MVCLAASIHCKSVDLFSFLFKCAVFHNLNEVAWEQIQATGSAELKMETMNILCAASILPARTRLFSSKQTWNNFVMNSQGNVRENYWLSELLLHSNTHLLLKDAYSVGIEWAYIAQGGSRRKHSLHYMVPSNKWRTGMRTETEHPLWTGQMRSCQMPVIP